jgi:hypothetical protein
MAVINPLLLRFLKEQLEAGPLFDDLEHHALLNQYRHELVPPRPNIYCLPHTLLLHPQNVDLEALEEKLRGVTPKSYSFRYGREDKELRVTVHSESELVFYSLRCLRTEAALHRDPCMLDAKLLADRLVHFYEHFYHKLYFRETVSLVLYWAYQKDLLEVVISAEALKLVVICIFVNFGYGVKNILDSEADRPERVREFKRMSSYSRMNARGDSEVMPELATQFSRYTVQEKRGFYMVSKKRYAQVKDIVPVYFPLLPLPPAEEEAYAQDVDKTIKSALEHETENMSICKNLSKIFNFLHNKCARQMRFVVDFGEPIAYRHEFSDHFELEVLHPVLHSPLARLRDSPMRALRKEVDQVHALFSKNIEPIQVIHKMLEKARS